MEIPVEIDGQQLVERHVDGGVTPNIFPPAAGVAGNAASPAVGILYGSDLYMIVAGKAFDDPKQVKARA